MLMGTARRSDELEQSLCETRSRKGTLSYVNEFTELQGFGRLHSAHARAGAGALPYGAAGGAGGRRAAVCCFVEFIYNFWAAPATIHTTTMALATLLIDYWRIHERVNRLYFEK